jgi:hypothetical protein
VLEMLPRIALALVLTLPLTALAQPATSSRHSGVIVAVEPRAGTITMEEVGVGIQSRNRVIQWVVELTPRTTIDLVARAPAATPAGWPGGYQGSPVALAALSTGDFVTVEGEPRQDRLLARAITVIRPATE